MGEELEKKIDADGGSKIKPPVYTRGCRRIVTGNLAGLQARHQPVSEAEAERSGNHQQVAFSAAFNRGFDPVIVGLGTIVGIVRAPIDLVDYTPLGRRGKRRHSEVGIAAEI